MLQAYSALPAGYMIIAGPNSIPCLHQPSETVTVLPRIISINDFKRRRQSFVFWCLDCQKYNSFVIIWKCRKSLRKIRRPHFQQQRDCRNSPEWCSDATAGSYWAATTRKNPNNRRKRNSANSALVLLWNLLVHWSL